MIDIVIAIIEWRFSTKPAIATVAIKTFRAITIKPIGIECYHYYDR